MLSNYAQWRSDIVAVYDALEKRPEQFSLYDLNAAHLAMAGAERRLNGLLNTAKQSLLLIEAERQRRRHA
jgi:hypothetical protein